MKKIFPFLLIFFFLLAIAGIKSSNSKTEFNCFPKKEKELNIKIIQVKNANDEKIYIEAEKACLKYGLGESCVNDIRSIAAVETNGTFNCEEVGDGGSSYGCFQINFHWPRSITTSQAKEIKTSVNWTLDYLISHGYKTNRNWAIMKHNGTPNTERTLAYLNKINRYKSALSIYEIADEAK